MTSKSGGWSRREFLARLPLLTATACSAPKLTAPEGSNDLHLTTAGAPPAVGLVIHRGDQFEISELAALRVSRARFTYYQSFTETAYHDAFAARLETLRAAGIDVLLVVHDFDPSDVTRVVRHLADAFPPVTFQLGNEWDAHGMRGADYASMMRRAVAEAPTARFASMGLASASSTDDARWAQFLTDYLRASGPRLDAWCLHAYGRMASRVTAFQAVMQEQMPIWLTEFGSEYGDAAQATELADLASLRRVARAYWYCLWDNVPNGHALLQPDLTRRTSWFHLQAIAQTALARLQVPSSPTALRKSA